MKRKKTTPLRQLSLLVYLLILCTTTQSKASPQWLHTDGNKILNEQNIVWTGHGVNIMDARDNSGCYTSNLYNDNPNRSIKILDAAINQWGATFIRLPLESRHSSASNSNSEILFNNTYWNGVQAIVNFAEQTSKAHILVTPWIDPTMPRNPNWLPTAATIPIYNKMVDTFYDNPSVIFGISNEPHMPSSSASNSNIVAKTMNEMVKVIRDREKTHGSKQHLIAVQGNSYTNNLSYYKTNPITADGGNNIIYEAHVYYNKVLPDIYDVAKVRPVIIGEYGPNYPLGQSPNDWQICWNPPDKNDGFEFTFEQIQSMIDELRKREISYAAWSLSIRSAPNMLAPFVSDIANSSCPVSCNASTPIQNFTSFGTLVYNDLRIPYRSKSVSAAINILLQ